MTPIKTIGSVWKQCMDKSLFVVGYYNISYWKGSECSVNPDFCIDTYPMGYNGQMKDNEVAGMGNHNTALFWEYDTRLGRRWNRDPVMRSWESVYAVFGGNPIMRSDPNGDDWYRAKDGAVTFDKNIHSQQNLNDKKIEGTYLGETVEIPQTEIKGKQFLNRTFFGDKNGNSRVEDKNGGEVHALSNKTMDEKIRQQNLYNFSDKAPIMLAGTGAVTVAAPAAAVGLVEYGGATLLQQGGKWLAEKYGTQFLQEYSKNVLSNRGNFFKVDWNDVIVNTLTGGKTNIWIKVAGKAWNATTDFSIDKGFVSGLNGSKSNGNIAVDVMFNGLKMSFGELYRNMGAPEALRFGSDIMFDQYKTEVKEQLKNNSAN